MTDPDKNCTMDRFKTRATVKRLLTEREEVLVLLYKASGRAPFRADEQTLAMVNRFCQVLIDYVAAAHFGLYRRFVEGKERRMSVATVAIEVYPYIDHSTQIAVAFNDRYGETAVDERLERLHYDLLHLGEVLARRIEMEDRLITALLSEPAPAPQTPS